MNQQVFKNLLAEGKTVKLIPLLLAHTQSQDVDLYNEVLQISARFAEYEKEEHTNTVSYAPSVLERKTIFQNADKIYNINHIDNTNFS